MFAFDRCCAISISDRNYHMENSTVWAGRAVLQNSNQYPEYRWSKKEHEKGTLGRNKVTFPPRAFRTSTSPMPKGLRKSAKSNLSGILAMEGRRRHGSSVVR
jgi:hypothetical protein